jgi:leucyl/phenylalanyl-tRNA--protein transferase
MNGQPYWISPADDSRSFPDVSLALSEPEGLLAVGGDLSSTRILSAYRHGIFPWYSTGQPILWWSPDPRTVLFPASLKISRSLRKTLRQGRFDVSFDLDFSAVIDGCASKRRGSSGTWITPEMRAAYCRLHEEGHAHSVECWLNGKLVGGLYGIAIGRFFFGESMFSRVSDASKVAFCGLVRQLTQWEFGMIDCQVYSEHLASLGASEIPRTTFIHTLEVLCDAPGRDCWELDKQLINSGW